MKFKIFVDGQYGTTGLKIHEMLENRDEIELLTINEEDKKNDEVKKELLNSADLVFLCLPDAASKHSVSLITNDKVKVIDASTAHRTNPQWVYGIPELTSTQREKIKNSNRVCVPGCHASGLIIAMKPLLEKGILPKSQKLICHSITGFSGGGSTMIDDYENGSFDEVGGQRPYALALNHKHLPEMKYMLDLQEAPLFTPSIGNFKQGMLVMSYLVKKDFLFSASRDELINLYKDYYKGENFINIIEENEQYLDNGLLNPMKCNNTNTLEISVYENETDMVVISRLDNLGKGASGAAVQCMNIMLGIDEKQGLKSK
ncbi:N-acetyl-gamma-glutamyl-phosphate reductase [Malaciobacter molluscorum LMG 25693]|uniref:N-acetyl-gamma-glutamyl-phosphate reductase n=1 Tax=Malaciobacter molluscorum LMG 25693 TaxID=870501 RepID=A0A2G1DKX3_9BACT|nr:N-acetyl-gamma-glutamyl-phosphate reductase [Malaciobacter molluscorum]AXX92703.1 N-acetyl-gamma-glutamylphosphate reductase, uncommon form [Malaciobacter molluscorum LMG 25693]PHO19120.1 N-acetyl-gamma-glutamyl-phosphate reductase [Malaciobacter molluscorum LMG 25693]